MCAGAVNSDGWVAPRKYTFWLRVACGLWVSSGCLLGPCASSWAPPRCLLADDIILLSSYHFSSFWWVRHGSVSQFGPICLKMIGFAILPSSWLSRSWRPIKLEDKNWYQSVFMFLYWQVWFGDVWAQRPTNKNTARHLSLPPGDLGVSTIHNQPTIDSTPETKLDEEAIILPQHPKTTKACG